MPAPELLQDYLARAAAAQPEARAVVLGEVSLTYSELERSSNGLGRLLNEGGCEPGDRVCLLAAKAPGVVGAMLATLKIGCCYVPIDAASPAARVERIIRAAEPAAFLVDESGALLLDETGAADAARLVGSLTPKTIEKSSFRTAFCAADLDAADDAPLARLGTSDGTAHILFTSGSTGAPKGVVVRHRNVIAFVEWARTYFHIQEGERVSGHFPFHFDLSTFDIFGAIASGAELHLVPAELNLSPPRLVEFIRESRLTQWFSVPSSMNLVAKFDALEHDSLPELRRVMWCGEVLPTPTLMYWMERLPRATFTNLYGPTETTIASSFHTIDVPPTDAREAIPIGKAIPGEELQVLGESMRPVTAGEIGELFIGGAGVTAGYWRDEAQSRAAFVRDGTLYRTGDLGRADEQGVVYFLGRRDSQIKSRGHRIELGEIEAALATVAGLAEHAVVAVDTEGFEGTVICCAYAPAHGVDLDPISLRSRLRRLVPSYMIPSVWQRYETLAKNVNGKLDRAAIRAQFEETVRATRVS
jgi:amino acid adenylation domain-containing protein